MKMEETTYVPRVDWLNIGVTRNMCGLLGILTPWGNLLFMLQKHLLFSDRYGKREVFRIGGLYIKWVRLKRFRNPSPSKDNMT